MKERATTLAIGAAIALLLIVLITLLLVFGLRAFADRTRLTRQNDATISDLRDTTATLDFLAQNLTALAQDSNELRDALGMPRADYPILRARKPSRQPRLDEHGLFLGGIDTLLQEHRLRITARRIRELRASPAMHSLEGRTGLSAATAAGSITLSADSHPYFTISVDPLSKRLRTVDFLGHAHSSPSLDRDLTAFIQARLPILAEHFDRLDRSLSAFRRLTTLPAITALAADRHLSILAPAETDAGYTMIFLQNSARLMAATLDPHTLGVVLGDRHFDSVDSFAAALPAELRSRTGAQAEADDVSSALRRIDAVLGTPDLARALAKRGIVRAALPREDIDYLHVDLMDSAGRRIGSFAVHKELGRIFLMDGEDVLLRALDDKAAGQTASPRGGRTFPSTLPSAGAARPPQAAQSNAVNLLLCGVHQGETDTIVVAHGDERGHGIRLLSIPRDLYYKGRKINAVYKRYGPDELTREIGDITGLPMTGYVVIDMYVFVDVVNLIGGIDVTLRTPLVDPSYRVRNNGAWATLAYKPGTYHLDGIAALRIARSRNTSSDFARAYRQQDLLEAIRHKLWQNDLRDVSRLYRLVNVAVRNVDTNLSLQESVALLLRFKGAAITGHYVLDTGNVLYQTYANTYYLDNSRERLPTGFDKGAWIVLPKNDDWNLIRRYVENVIEGDAP